jgi:NOL1/NOP2/fmu family ribosome biogenesis protein
MDMPDKNKMNAIGNPKRLNDNGKRVSNRVESEGAENGKAAAEWVDISGAARIWPHISRGEGHFIALLGRRGDDSGNDGRNDVCQANDVSYSLIKNISPFSAFIEAYLSNGLPFSGEIIRHERSLLLLPSGLNGDMLIGLRIARGGLLLGDLEKERFVPSQALAMALKKEDVRYSIDLPLVDAEKYLKGESTTPGNGQVSNDLPPGEAGKYSKGESVTPGSTPVNDDFPHKAFVLICVNGYPLGWAKWMDGRLKNQLPTGWAVN